MISTAFRLQLVQELSNKEGITLLDADYIVQSFLEKGSIDGLFKAYPYLQKFQTKTREVVNDSKNFRVMED